VKRAPRRISDSMGTLPLRAIYPMTALAEAACLDRRTLKLVLDRAGVRLFRNRRVWWVPLSELELKVPPLWESIKAAEMLRHLVEGGANEEG
jgi:hypothetical protein